MKLISTICLLFFTCQAQATPWYEFADNSDVDALIEEQYKPVYQDAEALSQQIFEHAGYVEKVLIANSLQNKKTDELETYRKIFIALLIKASDLGLIPAKLALIMLLNEGKYGVDKDLKAVKRFLKELPFDYGAPKPWYEFKGTSEDQGIIESSQASQKASREKYAYLCAKVKQAEMKESMDNEERAYLAQSYIFFLVKASEFGSKEAQLQLATILHEGSYGVQRDNDFATMLECEIGISNLLGLEAMAADDYQTYVKYFHYDQATKVLEVQYEQKYIYYYGKEAQDLAKIFGYLKQKTDHEAQIADILQQLRDQLKDLESVD